MSTHKQPSPHSEDVVFGRKSSHRGGKARPLTVPRVPAASAPTLLVLTNTQGQRKQGAKFLCRSGSNYTLRVNHFGGLVRDTMKSYVQLTRSPGVSAVNMAATLLRLCALIFKHLMQMGSYSTFCFMFCFFTC